MFATKGSWEDPMIQCSMDVTQEAPRRVSCYYFWVLDISHAWLLDGLPWGTWVRILPEVRGKWS